MKKWSSGYFSTHITKEQAKDSGMAVVLIVILIGLFTKNDDFFKLAAGVVLINMIFPMFFYPFAIFWFGISAIMGSITSKALLFIIYMVIVLPVALWRRLLRKDPLLLKEFKKSSQSVMKARKHLYNAADLEKPF